MPMHMWVIGRQIVDVLHSCGRSADGFWMSGVKLGDRPPDFGGLESNLTIDRLFQNDRNMTENNKTTNK